MTVRPAASSQSRRHLLVFAVALLIGFAAALAMLLASRPEPFICGEQRPLHGLGETLVMFGAGLNAGLLGLLALIAVAVGRRGIGLACLGMAAGFALAIPVNATVLRPPRCVADTWSQPALVRLELTSPIDLSVEQTGECFNVRSSPDPAHGSYVEMTDPNEITEGVVGMASISFTPDGALVFVELWNGRPVDYEGLGEFVAPSSLSFQLAAQDPGPPPLIGTISWECLGP